MKTHKRFLVLCLVLVMALSLAGVAAASDTKNLTSMAGKAGSLLNINKASAGDLMKLPGLDKGLVSNILDYRKAKGSFGSVDDLLKVKGMTKDIFSKIKPLITI